MVDTMGLTNIQHGDLPPPALQDNSKKKKVTRFSASWTGLKNRMGAGTAPSTSSFLGMDYVPSDNSHQQPVQVNLNDGETVDEIIVDRVWSEGISGMIPGSEHGATPEKSGGSYRHTTTAEQDSLAQSHRFCATFPPVVVFRWKIWPIFKNFFATSFPDASSETRYRQETWFVQKPVALWCSLFLIINWVFSFIFVSRPMALPDKIFFGGITPFLSFPIIFMIMFDLPINRTTIYQVMLVLAAWCWAFFLLADVYLCGFYNPRAARISCGGRDFLGLFYHASAMQTIALFGLKMARLPAVVAATAFFLTACSLIIPLRAGWTRHIVNFVIYHLFLLYMHYRKDMSDRRVYVLREQLKIQFRATQKAQINERKEADSKRRLTSYVFHDKFDSPVLIPRLTSSAQVRVPLNTALLAVQNMEASGTVAKTQEIEFNALSGSLSMMSKVLNDVLDFNRMDSGRFESVSRPYIFHQTMRSLFIPLRLATNARSLEFATHLDPNIDKIARWAACEAQGEDRSAVKKLMKDNPNAEGVVVGDEIRLRQIITNLASNACKFTPAGGKLTITTKLIHPTLRTQMQSSGSDGDSSGSSTLPVEEARLHPLSATHLDMHNLNNAKAVSPLEWIVVRIEVADTGYGIRQKDMVESRLFSAFNQTEQGRQQGGKGTGLGLALVRQIVKLSGGRLGVKSEVGKGSTFWVELPLGVGSKAVMPPSPLDQSEKFNGASVSGSPQKPEEDLDFMIHTQDAALNAAFMKASGSSSSTRSTSALHSLMEQGGRVELSLPNHDSRAMVPTRILSNSDIRPMPCHRERSSDSEGSTCRKEPPEAEPPLPLQSPTSKRHMFLAMPEPKTFGMDSNPRTPSEEPFPSPFTSGDSSSTDRCSSPNALSNVEQRLEVLVVDDDPLTRTLMKRMLSRMGCQVDTAENGELALEMILGAAHTSEAHDSFVAADALSGGASVPPEDKYAVVFLDNQMPVMSGLKAVEKLRDLRRQDFVVGITGNALLADQKEYLDAGADHVLTKPVLERHLRDMLTLATERRRQISGYSC